MPCAFITKCLNDYLQPFRDNMAIKKDVEYSNKFLGKTHKTPHHFLITPNLHRDLENVDSWQNLYKPFPFKSSMPVPICHPGANNFDDPYLQYVKNKETWKHKISSMKSTYKRLSRKKKVVKLAAKTGPSNVPLYLLNFAKLLREDPDEYFDSKYNWYCSGNGNLCLTTIGEKTYLLKSVNNELCWQLPTKNIEEKCKSLYVCDCDDAIYETVHMEFTKNILVGLRQRDQISFINVKNDHNILTSDFLLSVKSDGAPFTSVALSPSGTDFCYSSSDGSVLVQNLKANKEFEIFEKDSEFTVNNWSSVKYINDTCILFTSGNSIRLLDRRTNLKPDAELVPATLPCDRVTSSKLSVQKEYGAFFGTTHSIYFCDWRYIKGDGFVSKWTHTLKSAPIYMSTMLMDDGEIVSIDSQLSNESCMIVSTKNNLVLNESIDCEDQIKDEVPEYPIQTYAPWKPISICETLRQSQLQGMCLDPTINLKKRFGASTIGSVLSVCSNDIEKYTLNSMGDIFHQVIRKPNLKCDGEECETLRAWASAIEREALPLVVSSRINTNASRLAMLNTVKLFIRKDHRIVQKGFLKKKRHWIESLDNLNNYSDMCANELLSVWNLNDNKGDEEAMATTTVDTKFAVDSWMNQFALYDESIAQQNHDWE